MIQAFAEMREQQLNWLRGFGDVYALLAEREGRSTDAGRLLGWANSERKQCPERQPNESPCFALAMQDVAAALDGPELARLMLIDAAIVAERVHHLTWCSP